MRLRGALLLLLVVGAAMAADGWSITLASADPVVRHGLIWRCRITGDIPTTRFSDGPYNAQVALTQGGTTLASQDFPLTRLGQLLGGIDVVLVPATPPNGDANIDLTITVSDRLRRDLQHLTRQLPTPLLLQRRLEQQQRQLRERGDLDPLPALWLEQAGELLLDGPSLATCHQLLDLGGRLERWLAGERTPEILRALRDPVDGSVQPYRLHLPAEGPVTALVVLLIEPARPLRKCAWPPVPPAWLAAARAAGCAVVEVYPAGDVAWNGIAQARVWTTIAAAITADARLRDAPLVLVGNGRGAEAAVALAEQHPLRLRSLGLIEARLPVSAALPVEPHQRWLALHRAGERPAHLLGTTVVLADAGSPATRLWCGRLALAGNVPLTVDAGATQVEFWQALLRTTTAPRRDWMILAPQRLGRLHIEAMSDWGIAASLSEDAAGIRTTGIARLRSDEPLPARLDGKPYRAPTSAAPAPRKHLGQATGPVAAYANGPFTVVIGTGESAAAQAENRALAQAFTLAWAAHAGGRVRLVEDTGLSDESLPGQHLVLIGNPRSNLLLARLAARTTLPVHWDARSVSAFGQTFLRAERRALALAWPHPAHDGRLLVILDGRPAWNAQGLPLAGLPDLLISGPAQEDPPAVERTFDNEWR
ncbi:MAG: hypothetical protein H0W78_08175 [Planctomycetes bacterium]|nr:hypothetical protein [Planctomycetota bacterium]